MKSDFQPDRERRSLTNRQSEILRFIRDTIQQRGFAPTVREIGRHMKIKSLNGVVSHLKSLEKKGFIHRERNRSRAIQLTDLPNPIVPMPILGERRAIEFVERSGDDRESTDFGDLFKTGHFLFRVCRNGWSAQQLIDGDFLVMRNGTVQVGLSVLAVIHPKETILAQVVQEGGELRLLISDSLSIAMQDAEIFGILVAIIRRF